jgi:thiamine biosynthesis lipoprotein
MINDPRTARRFAALILVLSTMLCAVPARAEWLMRNDAIMGTRITVELRADDPIKGSAAIDAVMAEMHRIDDLMSHYKPESELSQINEHAAEAPVKVDRELFDLLKLSLHFSELTNGAFDITYAGVGHLYDYRKHIRPTEEQIRAALPTVNWRNLILDPDNLTVKFAMPGMRIDVGGIGKGYAVDRCIAILQSRGFTHAFVQAGGDSRIIGDHDGRPWVVGIRHPDDPNKIVTKLPLVDTAMSTSGDYYRFFDENGVRYHHIIDPRTGHPASKVRSATILGPTATETDGLSKTAFVIGAERTLELINRMPNFDAIFVTPDGRILYSKGLEPPPTRTQPSKSP